VVAAGIARLIAQEARAPLMARLFDSGGADVKTISRGSAPIRAATRRGRLDCRLGGAPKR